MDSIFLLTIGFIFLGALFSNVMKWRNQDRVLKDLEKFNCTVEMQNGKKIGGKPKFTPTAWNSIFLVLQKTLWATP